MEIVLIVIKVKELLKEKIWKNKEDIGINVIIKQLKYLGINIGL